MVLLALLLGAVGTELSVSLSESLPCSCSGILSTSFIVWSGKDLTSLSMSVTSSGMADYLSTSPVAVVEGGLSTGFEGIVHPSSSLLSPSPVMGSGDGRLANVGCLSPDR